MIIVDKTTHEERIIIDNALCCQMNELQAANHILNDIMERYFEQREQKDIQSIDAENIAVYIRIANALLWDVLTSYGFIIGDADYCRGVERAAKMIKYGLQNIEEEENLCAHCAPKTENE